MATRKLGLSALEKAVYTRLTTDALTNSYTVRSYVKDTDSMPYVKLGGYIGVRSTSFNNRDCPNEDNTVTIHVLSDYKGGKEALDMMNNITQALTSSALTIVGYTQFIALLEYSDITEDGADGTDIKRHGVLRFRFSMGQSS